MCAEDRRPKGVINIDGERTHDECKEECFQRGSPSWSYRTTFGSDETAPLPRCLCADPDILKGFIDDPDYDTYSLAGTERMPENYLDAEEPFNPDTATGDFHFDCKIACLKMNSSLWYAVWNSYGETNYDNATDSRCRCSNPDPGDGKLSSQLVEDPGYNTYSLAGPHNGYRPYHRIDAFDLDLDECIQHCSAEINGSTWVALWNAVGELGGALEAGLIDESKRCLCEDTSKEYAIDADPSYDMYSLRGEC